MTKIYFIIFVALALSGCSKEESAPNTCLAKIRNHFREQLTCRDSGDMPMSNNLSRGVYKGKEVYFVTTICPNCLTAPPQKGYTCEMEEVTFSDYAEVTAEQIVYNSCTKQFTE